MSQITSQITLMAWASAAKRHAARGLFSAIEHEQAVADKITGILKLRYLIPWQGFRPLLEELTGYSTRDWSKGGKSLFDPVLRFKVLVLQKFPGLSDDATEVSRRRTEVNMQQQDADKPRAAPVEACAVRPAARSPSCVALAV